MKVGFISLGCNKNLVDTEKTIAIFKKNKFEIVNNPEQADIIVINTCGFIESAKQEAINTILEMAEYKKQKCKYLIAMGCLVERYKKELEKDLPEVDLYIKYSSYNTLWEQIQELIESDKNKEDKQQKNANNIEKNLKVGRGIYAKTKEQEATFDNIIDRVITTGNNYAYVKIADGCSNRCTYCAIPYIRGPLKSRKMESIIEETKKLAKDGYSEIILTAQDTTKYGIDIYKEPMLAKLLIELCKIKEIKWIRFLYSYPETITDELINVVKENDKIVKYFDIPIQHISNSVLKRMNRQSSSNTIKKLIEKLRREIPQVIIRTTVMVGFPGETEKDFKELYNFLKEAKFDKLGAFMYSKEEGTPAENLKEQIHPATKKARYRKIMELQQKVSKEALEQKVGKKFEVMVEGKTKDGKYYVGRSYMDTPEIDGVIYIRNTKELKEGEFVLCEITNVNEYDLVATL